VAATKVLVIDNYDSFVYNLVQYLGEEGVEPVVVRNDAHSVAELDALDCDALVVSPGPGRPADAGVSCDAIRHFAGRIPILGVCLGHQAIGEVFGADVVLAPELRHGKTSSVEHDGDGVFAGIPSPLDVTRYHSLVIESESIPASLVVSARTVDGLVMGVRHTVHDVEGVQFHPESILTTAGHEMIRNFLARVRRAA
jgi:anthranilate synthase/aminodeoxychorismate synthase-like glutamine amidotransferase